MGIQDDNSSMDHLGENKNLGGPTPSTGVESGFHFSLARRLFFDLLADRKAFPIEEDEVYDWRIICLFLFTTIVLN